MRREAGAGGNHGIDIESEGGSAGCAFDTIFHVHHAGNFLDSARFNGRPVPKQLAVFVEELNHHRLRRAGEIANHILQQLGNSTSSRGSASVIFARTSAITSSPERVRSLAEAPPNNLDQNGAIGFNLTLISP